MMDRSEPEEYVWMSNDTNCGESQWAKTASQLWRNGKWEIPLYSTIFLLSVAGNVLVILTLSWNNRMRSVINVFLLNLAVSDLVLAVLCMPFTLIGTLLRDFIFGKWMCKLVPFLQATSVAASVWTLVALSVERYYAICHPLRSRKWQTQSHAHRLIISIWFGGSVLMLPIFVLSELQPISKGRHKCRENWSNGDYERAYNLFLDLILMVVPLTSLSIAYFMIATTLRKNLRRNCVPIASSGVVRRPEVDSIFLASDDCSGSYGYDSLGNTSHSTCLGRQSHSVSNLGLRWENGDSGPQPEIGLRHTNYERSLVYKERVIKMLFVVVLVFFICWTPLYVINTLVLFWPRVVYGTVGYKAISFCQLLAYTSGCCNPITYCFMNKGFRTSFISMFTCRKRK